MKERESFKYLDFKVNEASKTHPFCFVDLFLFLVEKSHIGIAWFDVFGRYSSSKWVYTTLDWQFLKDTSKENEHVNDRDDE